MSYGHDEKSGFDYWIIRNSWGKSWGDEGYAKLCRGIKCSQQENGAGSFGFAGILKQIFYPHCSEYDGITTENALSAESHKDSGLISESFEHASKWVSKFFSRS